MEVRQAPGSAFPVQARPVVRGLRAGPATGASTGSGVVASANRCQNLTGLAQQMCYATVYGI